MNAPSPCGARNRSSCIAPTWCARPAAWVFFPLDERLGLLPGRFSPYLVEGIVRLGTALPFEQVPALLHFFTGVRVGSETVRRLTEEAGAALVAAETEEIERIERETPAPEPGPAIQQLSADGAMVPLLHGEWAEVRTVAIGAIEQRPSKEGGTEPHTTALSYFSRLTDAATFTRLATLATHRRGTEHAKTVCAVMDGATWLQSFVDHHRPDAVRILDFPHAAEYLSKAAHAAFGAGTERATSWLEEQLHDLKHEDPDGVLLAVRELAMPSADASETREGVLHYLEERRDQLAYPTFRAHGYPIGSGSVESANKLVVEGRLKGSGMHWKRAHVDPMLALRAAYCGGLWEQTWPVIWQRLRQQEAVRRQERRRARRPPPAAPTEPPVPVAVTSPASPPVAPKKKLVVDGQPTKEHPWRRPWASTLHRQARAIA